MRSVDPGTAELATDMDAFYVLKVFEDIVDGHT
jgi:hypothetical protein